MVTARVAKITEDLRKFEFHTDRALYRDSRKVEVVEDQAAMPIVWDQTSNHWKHFLATKVEIQATCVEQASTLADAANGRRSSGTRHGPAV